MTYDSSQLLNIINNANAYCSSFYPALNNFGANASNPFGPFNNVAALKINIVPIGTGAGLKLGSTGSSYHSNGLSLAGKNQNSSSWSSLGYDSGKGSLLAQNALDNSVGWTGYCARHVKSAISNSGLGSYQPGNACDMFEILDDNPNFKKISPVGVDLKSLPAGCVLVYDKGVAGYSSRYGHTEITTGTGKAVSDGITNNLHKTPTAIYMPVSSTVAVA